MSAYIGLDLSFDRYEAKVQGDQLSAQSVPHSPTPSLSKQLWTLSEIYFVDKAPLNQQQSSCTQVPHKPICLQNEGVGA
jgi:hypothetical protein